MGKTVSQCVTFVTKLNIGLECVRMCACMDVLVLSCVLQTVIWRLMNRLLSVNEWLMCCRDCGLKQHKGQWLLQRHSPGMSRCFSVTCVCLCVCVCVCVYVCVSVCVCLCVWLTVYVCCLYDRCPRLCLTSLQYIDSRCMCVACMTDVLGSVSRRSNTQLFPTWTKLLIHQASSRRPDVHPGAEVWWAAAEAVESTQLQGSCQSSRDAAGRRALQQQEVPDHWTRLVLSVCLHLPARPTHWLSNTL